MKEENVDETSAVEPDAGNGESSPEKAEVKSIVTSMYYVFDLTNRGDPWRSHP